MPYFNCTVIIQLQSDTDFNSFLNIDIVLECLMSNGQEFKSKIVLKDREVEDNFVRGTTSKYSSADHK